METSGYFPAACDVRFGIAASGAPTPGTPFSTVEVSLDEWARGMPEGVDFCVRLGDEFARPAKPGALSPYCEAVEHCRRVAAAAAGAGRGSPSALLIEFPPSFAYNPDSRRHVDRVLRDLAGFPLAVMFFNMGWYTARVVEGLKARGAALCLADMPLYPSAPPSVDVVTSKLVYIKFYARLREEKSESRARAGMSAWLSRIEALAARTGALRAIFSAERTDDAARLAEMWREMVT